ncbi:MAG TPA: hypothetical protein VH481_04710 [Nitrososphaeraceae archaeon]
MFLGVIFLVTAIIFVSSTPVINHAFAKSHDSQAQDGADSKQAQDGADSKQAQDGSGSKNYENFLNCLSDASGSNSYPAGDQIVNCFAESGYIQGSSSASNTADSQDNTGSVDVNALHDGKSDKSSSNDNGDKSSSNDNGDSSSNDNGDSSSNDNVDSSSNNSFIDSAYDDGSNE